MYSLDFKIVIIKKGEIVEAKLSKFILMMLKTKFKNQESSKFQESKNRSIKASFKNQRVIQSRIKIQVKNQEKTQLR
ncbi:hypothetical protein GmHk_03G006880 [Glycine max]|nr:hypothetical protein GmHk_03G006880 [Glycine max]